MKFQMSFKVVAAVVVLVLVGASIAIGVGLWLGESEPAAPSTAYQANLIGEPVSIDLPAQEDAVVAHKSGARIEVPEGATREQSTVSIAEVEPPASSLEVRRAFDFSVGGAELLKPVTIHIPFELGQGEDVSDIYALHWDEEVAGWKPVLGVVDESAQTIAVITSDLSMFSWAWVKVDANCDVTPSTVETGESFTVTSAGTSLTSGNIKIHMKPDIKGPVELSDQPEAKSEVAIVGKGEEFQLDVTNALEIPAEYLIRCRIFWETIGPDVELQSQERPFTLIAVEGDAPPDLAIALPSALATARDRLVGPAVAGQDVTVRFDVGNYGRGPSGSFDIGFYLSRSEGGTDIPVGERPDLPSYEAGDVLYQREDVVQIPEDLPPGPYWLCGQIEIQGSVVDSNEDNDVSCTRTYVLPDMSGDFDETIHPVPFAEPDHWVFVPSDLASIEAAAGVTSHTDDRRELYRQLALDLMRRPEVLNRLRGDRIAGLFELAGADALTGVRFNKDAIDASATINDVSELVAGAYELGGWVEGASVSLAWLGFGIEVAEFGTLWGDIRIATGVYRHIELEAAQQTLDLLRALDLQPSAEWNAAIGDAQDELDEMTSEDEWRKFFASIREHEEELTDAYIDLAVAGGVLAGKIAAGVVLGKFAVVTAPIWIGVAVAVDTIHETDAFWDNLSIATGLAQVYERLYSLDIENQGLGIPEPDSLRLEVLAYTKFKFYHYLHEAADNRALRGRLIGNVGTNTLDQHIEHIAGERDDALEEAVDAVRLATIELGQSSISLMSGQALQLEQPVLRSGSGRILTDYDVEWLSSNPFVAKVSSSGEVTGGISGEAVISVRGHVRDEFIFDPEDFPPGARVYTSSFPVPESHQQAGTITTQSTTITFSHVVVPTYVTGEVVVTVEKSTTTDSDGQSTPSTETPTTPGAGEPFARNPAEEFDLPATNADPRGIWSDGTTMWVADVRDPKLFAYSLATKARDPAKDFNTLAAAGNKSPIGIRSDGTTMWVAGYYSAKIYAYSLATKARDPAKDFNTLAAAGNSRPTGIWSDGTTMWVAEFDGDKIYAYNLATKARDPARDFNTLAPAGNADPQDVWSDGATMWVADYSDAKLYAYNLATKGRDPAKDFNTLADTGNTTAVGNWSDGTTMWVADKGDRRLYAYNMPPRSSGALGDSRAGQTPLAISSNLWHTCVLTADGLTTCWGDNREGQTAPPKGVTFTAIATGGYHSCGLLRDGTAICWGKDDYGQATPPDGEAFASITAGVQHTCALRADGMPICWGKNTDRHGNLVGQATPPEGEKFVSIAAGGDHTCGLRANGTVKCWGWGSFGASRPPNVNDISSLNDHSYWNSCGLRTDGTAICWGHNNWGQASPPAKVSFTSITSGDVHTCGLQSTGVIICWGSNTKWSGSPHYGQATPPEGEVFAAVSAGYNHTCGITTDARVVCWGDNSFGQSTPPSDLKGSSSAAAPPDSQNEPLNDDRVFINGGTLNGSRIDSANPSLTVPPGQSISGTVNLTVANGHGSHAIFPVGATVTWGDHQSSYWSLPISPPAFGSSRGDVAINLTAPSTQGTYAIIFAAQAETSLGHVMSATHWASGGPRWDNGDDIAGWDASQIDFAIANGYARAPQYGWKDPISHFGASAIKIIVRP